MDGYAIREVPPAAFYVPNFISEEEQRSILTELHQIPRNKWTMLSHRRLLSLPSTLTGQNKNTLLAAPLPKFLDNLVLTRFKDMRIFEESPHHEPNHVLVNEYQPGEGIMPHTDGPAYHPTTATVSLGSHSVLEVYKKAENEERESSPTWCILQEPRSLLVTTKDMYKDTLHGISEMTVDDHLGPERIANWDLLGDKTAFETGTAERQTRVSLTYRDVLKVAKLGGALNFMKKR